MHVLIKIFSVLSLDLQNTLYKENSELQGQVHSKKKFWHFPLIHILMENKMTFFLVHKTLAKLEAAI